MHKRFVRFVPLFAVAAATLMSPGPALASFPGTNGKLVVLDNDTNNLMSVLSMTSGGAFDSNPVVPKAGSGVYIYTPAWSPDGRKVAYFEGRDLHITSGDGSGDTTIASIPPPGGSTPYQPYVTWAPSGLQLAYSIDGQLSIINADGTNPHTVNTGGQAATYPQWSPLGDRIAYVVFDSGRNTSYIVTVTPNGQTHTTVTNPANGEGDWSPDWSPDGAKLVFVSSRLYQGHTIPNEVYTVNADGTGLQMVTAPTSDGGNDHMHPVWSPDGTQLMYEAVQGVYAFMVQMFRYTFSNQSEALIGQANFDEYQDLDWSAAYTPGPDTIPPVTYISSPAASQTVSGHTTVDAGALDNVGVTKVELYVDGQLTATDTTAPYTLDWDTFTASEGAHSLITKAYDAASNVGTSDPVSVTVANLTPVLRLANWQTHERLFTTSQAEADNAVNNLPGWVNEGVDFKAAGSNFPAAAPVYRLANWQTHERLFTTSQAEADNAVNNLPGWVNEGTAFYSVPCGGSAMPVYRLANFMTHERLFTPSQAEVNNAVANYPGWVNEGTGFCEPAQ